MYEVIASMMHTEDASPKTTTITNNEGRSSSSPDLRFIPKMDATQEKTVTQSVVIVRRRSNDMILFRRLSCDRLMYASPSSTYSSSFVGALVGVRSVHTGVDDNQRGLEDTNVQRKRANGARARSRTEISLACVPLMAS